MWRTQISTLQFLASAAPGRSEGWLVDVHFSFPLLVFAEGQ